MMSRFFTTVGVFAKGNRISYFSNFWSNSSKLKVTIIGFPLIEFCGISQAKSSSMSVVISSIFNWVPDLMAEFFAKVRAN